MRKLALPVGGGNDGVLYRWPLRVVVGIEAESKK